MKIKQSRQADHVVLTLVGRLDLTAVPRIQRLLYKHLAQQPPAIICDLTQVETIDPVCAGVFTAVRQRSLGPPGTMLVLCGARPAVADTLTQLRVPQALPMYATLDEALTHAHARPSRLQERLGLGPILSAPGVAQGFVRKVCYQWELEALAESAILLAGELVTNAVVHARTPLELELELEAGQLTIAVRDQDPNIQSVLASGADGKRGHGLYIVDKLSTTWGARQHPGGGKVVWCALTRSTPSDGPSRPTLTDAATWDAAQTAVAQRVAGPHPGHVRTEPGSHERSRADSRSAGQSQHHPMGPPPARP